MDFYRLEKDKALPKSWKEFCEKHPIEEGECYIEFNSDMEIYTTSGFSRNLDSDKNLLPDKQTADAILALCQLIQLRDCYNDGWKTNWDNEQEHKHIIHYHKNHNLTDLHTITHAVLAFKKEEVRDEFLNNFKDIIETAKCLL